MGSQCVSPASRGRPGVTASFNRRSTNSSFARREVVAPMGLWERGAEASGNIPPSARLLTPEPGSMFPWNVPIQEKNRAPKALATSPSGEKTIREEVHILFCFFILSPEFLKQFLSCIVDEFTEFKHQQTGLLHHFCLFVFGCRKTSSVLFFLRKFERYSFCDLRNAIHLRCCKRRIQCPQNREIAECRRRADQKKVTRLFNRQIRCIFQLTKATEQYCSCDSVIAILQTQLKINSRNHSAGLINHASRLKGGITRCRNSSYDSCQGQEPLRGYFPFCEPTVIGSIRRKKHQDGYHNERQQTRSKYIHQLIQSGLKHSVISWLAEAKFTVDQISDMTATHPNTVRRIYRKFSPDYLEDVATSLSKTFSFTNQFAKLENSKLK